MSQELRYALLTVRLDQTANREDAFQQIKKALGLENPFIDEKLGATPFTPGGQQQTGMYVVGVEINTAQRPTTAGNRHPIVVGILHSMLYTSDHRPDLNPRPGVNKKQGNKGPGF